MCSITLLFLLLPIAIFVWKKLDKLAKKYDDVDGEGTSWKKTVDDGTNKYVKWFNYRENLLKKSHPLTQDIINNPQVAEREFNYWLECLCHPDPNVAVWFLLNVCEKIEYQNPRVVMAMRDAVCSSTRNDYDIMKDRLYRLLHGGT